MIRYYQAIVDNSSGAKPMTDPIAQAGLPHWTPEDGGWKLWGGGDSAPDDFVGNDVREPTLLRSDRRGCGSVWKHPTAGWLDGSCDIIAYLAKPANVNANLPTAIATCEAAGYGVVKRRTRDEWEMFRCAAPDAEETVYLDVILALNLIAPDPDPMREALIASGLSGEQLERSLAAVKGVG